jgi:hypothetical protein
MCKPQILFLKPITIYWLDDTARSIELVLS